MRIAQNNIQQLEPNQIFVFGSNSQGHHAGGAARIAHEKFRAKWGVSHGLTGQTYAIDTMSGIEAIHKEVKEFIEFAQAHKHLEFLVTEIGCGIAGYSIEEIAPLFAGCSENVLLPVRFIEKL